MPVEKDFTGYPGRVLQGVRDVAFFLRLSGEFKYSRWGLGTLDMCFKFYGFVSVSRKGVEMSLHIHLDIFENDSHQRGVLSIMGQLAEGHGRQKVLQWPGRLVRASSLLWTIAEPGMARGFGFRTYVFN